MLGTVGADGSVAVEATPFEVLTGLILSGDVILNLAEASSALLSAIAVAPDDGVNVAALQGSLATLRRLSSAMDQPPLEWMGELAEAHLQPTQSETDAFTGLWEQHRLEVSKSKPWPNEPIFSLALVEQALGMLPGFKLAPGTLPAESLRDWFGAGGGGLEDRHTSVRAAMLSDVFWAAWGGFCVRVASLAIQRRLEEALTG
jgi:hypothetical protein